MLSACRCYHVRLRHCIWTWTWRHVLKLFNGCSALPPYCHDMEASVCMNVLEMSRKELVRFLNDTPAELQRMVVREMELDELVSLMDGGSVYE